MKVQVTRTTLLASITLLALFATAQRDSSVFNVMKKVEVDEYVFMVPEKWKNIPEIDISSKDRKFDFTGIGLPLKVKNEPLTATFILRKYQCPNIRPAEDFILSEFTSYPDRVTPPGFNYERDSVIISSGEKALVFFTHYLRRSKHSNYTRLDMIAYSKKRKAAYMFTVTYQYNDPSYAIEKDLKLKSYALEVLRTLVLR